MPEPFNDFFISFITMIWTHSETFSKYFSNTFWMLAEKICRMGTMFFVTVWMARYLGAEQFGILNYAFSYVGLFTPFVLLGLENLVVKNLIDRPHTEYTILGTAIMTQWIGAFLAFLGLVVAVFLFENQPRIQMFILIVGAGHFFMPLMLIDQWFQSKVIAKYSSMARMFQLVGGVLLRLTGIIIAASLTYFIVLFCIDYILMAIGFVCLFRYKKMHLRYLRFDKNLSRNMLSRSLPLIFSSLVIAIYMRIDQVMIGHLMDETSVGLYAAAVRISQAWYFIPTIVASSLYPAILSAKKEGGAVYAHRLSQVYRIVFYLSLFIAIIMYFFSDMLVGVLYGENFIDSNEVFQIHIWAFVFAALGTVMNRFVITEGLQRYEMIYLFMAMVLNIILNRILIVTMGIKGAALSTLISQFAGNMVFPLFLSPALREHIFFQVKALLFMKIRD